MTELPHGHTNRTVAVGRSVVEKQFIGPDAGERRARELACLTHLQGVLPVPTVWEVARDAAVLRMRAVDGVHAQTILDEWPGQVLGLIGAVARVLHDLDGRALGLGLPGGGPVFVHGDFGPQNVVLDPAAWEITALLDWEEAHYGQPVEDVAWAEWIVRTHHPRAVPMLDSFWTAYEFVPPWPARHAVMIVRCTELLRRAEASADPGVAALWRQRLVATEAFAE